MFASICLLAGNSIRMGKPKQHVLLGQFSFLEHVLATLGKFKNRFSQMVFVGRKNDLKSEKAISGFGGIWVENPKPELGSLSSIRLGLVNFPSDSGFLLWPIDHPLVSASTIEKILRQAVKTPQMLVIPSFQNRRGHPSFFPSWAREELFNAPLDEGARWVLKKFSEKIVHLILDDVWTIRNLNTPELLSEAQEWLSKIESEFHRIDGETRL